MMSLARKFLFAASLVIVAWPVFAAELSVPPPMATKSPPRSVKSYDWSVLKPGKWSGNWSGFYVGGELGGNWQSTTFQDPSVAGTLMGCCLLIATMGSNAAVPNGSGGSFLGGADFGWNYQIGRLVIGSDFDFTKTNLNSSRAGTIPAGVPGTGAAASEAFTIRTDWTATATATSGIAWDRWLGYAKAGVAWAHDSYGLGFDGVFNCFCGQAGPFDFQSNNGEVRTGWTAGLGLAWAFSDRLSAKLEYDYLYFGAKPVDFNGVINAAGAPYQAAVFGTNNSQQISQVKLGVNYKFASLDDTPTSPTYTPTQRTLFDAATSRRADASISGYDWSGFYVGGHAGAVWGRTGFQDPSATGVIANCCVLFNNMTPGLSAPDANGFSWLGGANAGWNYQIGGLVFGTNVDFSETNLNTTNVGSIPGATAASPSQATESFSTHTDWTGTVTALFGITDDSRLWYSKAGVAFAHDSYSLNVTGPNTPAGPPVIPAPGPYTFQARSSDTRTGLTVGTGLAWAISDSWIAKVEYDFLYFPTKEVDFTAPAVNNIVGPGIGAPQVTTPITFNTNSSQYISQLELGLDYKFTPGGAGGTGSVLPAASFGRAPAPLLVGYDWSGFYVGGHIGGGRETAAFQDPSLSSLLSDCCYYITLGELMPNSVIPDGSGSAFLGGVQAGWNYQVGRFGLGGDLDFSLTNLNVRGTGISQTTPASPTLSAAESLTARTDWTSTATATLGLTAFNNVLWYNKFGIAVAHTNYGYSLAGDVNTGGFGTGPFGFQATAGAINVGWTVGTGVKLALDAKWSASLEYDYLDFGSQSVDFSGPSGNISAATSPFTSNTTFRQQISELKLGLNYKFQPGLLTQ
jgi:outer membrane immunogenic protein